MQRGFFQISHIGDGIIISYADNTVYSVSKLPMGNYEEHKRYGNIVYIIIGVAIAGAVASGGLSFLVGLPLAVVVYPFVRAGAAFPDIDHHASRPHHGLRRLMFVIGTIGSFFLFYTQSLIPIETGIQQLPVDVPPEISTAMIIHIAALLCGWGLRESVSYFRPKHRGITHRIPTGIALTLGICGFIWYTITTLTFELPTLFALGSGGAFFLGFLSHLRCDDMLIPAITSPVDRIRKQIS